MGFNLYQTGEDHTSGIKNAVLTWSPVFEETLYYARRPRPENPALDLRWPALASDDICLCVEDLQTTRRRSVLRAKDSCCDATTVFSPCRTEKQYRHWLMPSISGWLHWCLFPYLPPLITPAQRDTRNCTVYLILQDHDHRGAGITDGCTSILDWLLLFQ